MAIQFTGLASGLDTQSIVSDLMRVERMRVDAVEKEKTAMEWKKDAWSDMNAKLYTFYKESLFEFKSNGTYSTKTVSSSNDSVVSVSNSPDAVKGAHSVTVTNMAKGSFLTGSQLTTDRNGDAITSSTTAGDLIDFGVETSVTINLKASASAAFDVSNEVTIESTDTINDILTKISDLELDMTFNYDSNFDRFFVSSTNTGTDAELSITDNSDALAGSLLSALGFGAGVTTGSAGENAAFSYNGTSLSSETNEVTVNGLSLVIKADAGSASISVNQDTDAIYDKVKNFVLKYNELVIEMNEKLNAESSRGYAPLTDDEKSAMTESDIELWETRIKDSLLRNDSILSSIVSEMRTTLTSSSGLDTTDMDYNYLSDIGIVTGGYAENGILHIQGDDDDSVYSLRDNKLKEAIESNPDGIAEFLSALGTELYDKMNERMQTTTISSSLTFYNDKLMTEQMSDYDDDIATLEDRLLVIESRYYKQFTAMEQAIQQSNSTGDWLAQQLSAL